MKRVLTILAIACLSALATSRATAAPSQLMSQHKAMMENTISTFLQQDSTSEGDQTAAASTDKRSFQQVIKRYFLDGGPGFMGIVLVCLILGLAIVIERIIYLNLADTNTKELTSKIENALSSGGVTEAKEVARNTSGPVASIYYQGLDRVADSQPLQEVEKAIASYGSVQVGQLEKNISWISLFIALAPMLGFMGTVIGMIEAFDAIQTAGDISPTLVAGGIKVALLTTVFGLIVAIILQIFYNYIVSKVDGIVNKMEDASILLVDMLYKYKK